MSSSLYQRIYAAVSRIPPGRVVTYGQIASLVGSPRGARLVGWALSSLPAGTTVPWQRVVNREGRITIANLNFPPEAQAALLQNEGVEVQSQRSNYSVNLKKYLWRP